MRSVVWSMSASCRFESKTDDQCQRGWDTLAFDEMRLPVWGSIGVPVSRRSCGSLRPEPEDSHVEGVRSIDVDPLAAHAGVANKAGNRIAAARSRAK